MQPEEFGKRLKAVRKRSNLTQEGLGLELGVSKATVSSWERGKDSPKFSYLPDLKRILDVSLDELICGDEPESGSPIDQAVTTSNDGEAALLKAYRRLPIKRRKALLGLLGE